MSRWAPEIMSALWDEQTGALAVAWRAPDFQDFESPDHVIVEEAHGFSSGLLDPDETSYAIDGNVARNLAKSGIGLLTIGVIFQWGAEPDDDVRKSGVEIPNPYWQQPGVGAGGPERPRLRATAHARTMAAPASITLGWESNNWTEGRIEWGPNDNPRAFLHRIKPGPGHYNPEIDRLRYNGEWRTDVSLQPSTIYSFSLAVRNPHETPTWFETSIAVRSADDTLSIREYMIANALDAGTPLRGAMQPELSTHIWLTGRPGA